MKVTATSVFHGTLSISFTGCKEGVNVRRLRGPRAKYCLDYNSANTHVCGCGYPVSRTRWDAGEQHGVEAVTECGATGDAYGSGYIRFEIYELFSRTAK